MTTPYKRRLIAEAWHLLFTFLIKTRGTRDQALAAFGLTPVDAKALHSLSGDEGRTMGSLAEEWLCDASNVTWMVDRLEKRGLAQRQTCPTDRRVKLVALTPRGEEVKSQFFARLMDPPEELYVLTVDQLAALNDVLLVLVPEGVGTAESLMG